MNNKIIIVEDNSYIINNINNIIRLHKIKIEKEKIKNKPQKLKIHGNENRT